MKRQLGAVLTLFTWFGAASLAAQQKPVCSLLTVAEVTAALGPSKTGVESEMPVPGAPAGAKMSMCSWPLTGAGGGGLHLSLAKLPPTASFDQLVALSNQSYDALKAKGWTEEKKDFGGMKCLLAKPPGGNASDPFTSNCMTAAKGMIISAASLTKTAVPVEKIKVLVDAAVGRL